MYNIQTYYISYAKSYHINKSPETFIIKYFMLTIA